MTDAVALERISGIQDEILRFTWDQVADRVDTFYVQGKVSDDESGRILMVSGNMPFGVRSGRLVKNSEVLTKEEFRASSAHVVPRMRELHDLLFALQGRSPVRFRWVVDTRTGRVESDWTYWMDQIQAHLAAAQSGSAPVRGQDTP